jgi:cell division septation protein DedD
MRNNETGEYELVVGNKQLLSGFFIVVLLCAVAFAMGYVVGENSHTVKAPDMASAGSPPKAEARPDAASPAPSAPEPARSEAADPVAAETKASSEAPPQPTTKAARDAEPEAPRRKPPEPKPAPPEPRGTPETAPGQFWQVTATTNHDSAQNLLQSLREKGFPAVLSPGPNNFTRVLVGPYADTVAMGKAKSDLEGAGFNKLVRK